MLIKTFPPQAVLLQLSKCMIHFKTEYFFFFKRRKEKDYTDTIPEDCL